MLRHDHQLKAFVENELRGATYFLYGISRGSFVRRGEMVIIYVYSWQSIRETRHSFISTGTQQHFLLPPPPPLPQPPIPLYKRKPNVPTM